MDGDVLHVVQALLCGYSQLPVQVCTSLEIGHPNLMNTQRLVALGGHDGISRLRSAEIYDPGLKPKISHLFMLDM